MDAVAHRMEAGPLDDNMLNHRSIHRNILLVEHCFVDRGRGRLSDITARENGSREIGGRHTQHCRAGGSALFEIMVSFD
jgi:hypothetical protein